jgi:hypothetical protein
MNFWGSLGRPKLDAGGGAGLRTLAFELRDVTALATTGQSAWLVPVTQLHGLVPVAVAGAHLQNMARSGLDYGDRNYFPGLVIDLRHPDLAAEQSNGHRYRLVVRRRWERATNCRGLPTQHPMHIAWISP